MTTNKIIYACTIKAFIIAFLSMLPFIALGRTIEVRHFDSIFQQFDTVTIAREDGSVCVYERNESSITCKNIVNGKKNGCMGALVAITLLPVGLVYGLWQIF
mgnify:CR=1 FL=1